ncbi:hypothetical protein DFQ29_007820 [Apophysomyces sp. BC1021]|nr:hypothetical protein DFQ29_007820 [Apophysomyces sp. BC1021]
MTLGEQRAGIIKDAFKYAWEGYRLHAFGHDELQPMTNKTTDSRYASYGVGPMDGEQKYNFELQATIFDALDTMIIMGLEEEYAQALEHVETVQWSISNDLSKTFETNIRYLGGLLAAHDLRPNQMLLDKAIELVRKVILPAYDTPNFIPAAYVNTSTGKPVKDRRVILAEFGSLQLELVRLSQITGEKGYGILANWVIAKLSEVKTTLPGLYPMIWDLDPFGPSSGKLLDSCYATWANTATGLAPESWSWIDKHQNISSFPMEWQTMDASSGFIAQDLGYDLRPGNRRILFVEYC